MSWHNWIQGSRPKTLSAGIGPVLVGTGFVTHTGAPLDPITFLLTIVCTLLLQIGTNLANDYYDFIRNIDGPDRLGPLRMSASGKIPPQSVKRGFQICLLMALFLGIFLIWQQNAHPLLLGIGLLSVALSWAYSGGPFPLSHHALGEITALIVFGPMAVWGTAALQLGRELPLSLPALYWGLGPGLISASMMALNNLRDLKSDSSAGKTTLATLMGEKSTRLIVLIPIIAASTVPILGAWMTEKATIALVALLPIPFIPTWKHIYREAIDARLNSCLAKIGMFLAFYCLGITLTLAL